MAKLMFVTPKMARPPAGGRALLSKLHQDCLREILGFDLVVHELQSSALGWAKWTRAATLGYIDGVTPIAQKEVVEHLRRELVERVYLNGSNLGRLAWSIRRHCPSVEILTLFHNVESRFFLGAFKAEPTARAVGVLIANYQAEKLAVRESHRRITLTCRDSSLLARIYGRTATDIVPIGLKDRLSPKKLDASMASSGGEYFLFVGGAFYANVEGIRWFARRVAPHLRSRTVVVGRGLEAHKAELEQCGAISVVGHVNDLAPWYLGAKAAVAPIFDGSGMKTKVAEALMYGTPVVGTTEAFVGYENALPKAGWICDNELDFIRTLNELERRQIRNFDPDLRRLYQNLYSERVIAKRLSEILGQSAASDDSALFG